MKNTVPPTLDYLRRLQATGHQLTDFEITKLLPDLYEVRVYTAGSEKPHEFHLTASRAEIDVHHPEAVEFTGFGPRGLSNLIHAAVMERVRTDGVSPEQFQVWLSSECWQRVEPSLWHWRGYGYTFHVRPSLSGCSFSVERAARPEQE